MQLILTKYEFYIASLTSFFLFENKFHHFLIHFFPSNFDFKIASNGFERKNNCLDNLHEQI